MYRGRGRGQYRGRRGGRGRRRGDYYQPRRGPVYEAKVVDPAVCIGTLFRFIHCAEQVKSGAAPFLVRVMDLPAGLAEDRLRDFFGLKVRSNRAEMLDGRRGFC